MFFKNNKNSVKNCKSQSLDNQNLSDDNKILFRCLNCSFEEYIPKFIVTILDFFDGGDPTFPPRFSCKLCSGYMHPVLYKNRKGITYKI